MVAFVISFVTICLIFLFENKSKEKTKEKTEPFHSSFDESVKEQKTYRPVEFDDYIGQKKPKMIIKNYIKGTQKRNRKFPHMIINGKAGTGKTTLAEIVAGELKQAMITTIASNIDSEEKVKKYIEDAWGGILFLDEIHALKRKIAEKLYSAMEDFKIDGQPIRPFTLIGATTEIGEIIKNRKPFYDRFKVKIDLDDYSNDDISKILKIYKEKVFPKDKVPEKVFNHLAKNSRLTPRLGIRLLEAGIYFNLDLKNMLKSFNIIKNGLTYDDYKILDHLKKANDKVGVQALASYLGTSTTNYLYEIEPYLHCKDLVRRARGGREITTEGKKILNQLKENL